jgi:hypothetical protein
MESVSPAVRYKCSAKSKSSNLLWELPFTSLKAPATNPKAVRRATLWRSEGSVPQICGFDRERGGALSTDKTLIWHRAWLQVTGDCAERETVGFFLGKAKIALEEITLFTFWCNHVNLKYWKHQRVTYTIVIGRNKKKICKFELRRRNSMTLSQIYKPQMFPLSSILYLILPT